VQLVFQQYEAAAVKVIPQQHLFWVNAKRSTCALLQGLHGFLR
jgi:hypothetical protein